MYRYRNGYFFQSIVMVTGVGSPLGARQTMLKTCLKLAQNLLLSKF